MVYGIQKTLYELLMSFCAGAFGFTSSSDVYQGSEFG